ncbi:MAG: PTS sugar transporter subunit IIA [Deltaproteobacteria bacterium]|nr:PTS sugar transporter subunit IIA [Deltaproteobacteria bacterium]
MAKKAPATASAPDDEPLLTLLELSNYLHLDEGTVFKLVSAGKIPGVHVGTVWRFQRKAIDEWIAAQLAGEDESFADIPDGMKVPLEDLLATSSIIPNLRAKDPIGVIEELAARAMSNGWLHDKPWFVGAVVERESLSSTAMEGGVAFLHTRAKDKGKINRPFVICGRSWEGIPFGAPDGKPTYMFFLLGLKYDKLHLPILGRLARSMRNPATISRMRSLSSPDQLRALLLKEDAAARSGIEPIVHKPEVPHPKLDRTLRLRAIRRLEALRKPDAEPEVAAKPAKKPAKAAGAKPAVTKRPRATKK